MSKGSKRDKQRGHSGTRPSIKTKLRQMQQRASSIYENPATGINDIPTVQDEATTVAQRQELTDTDNAQGGEGTRTFVNDDAVIVEPDYKTKRDFAINPQGQDDEPVIQTRSLQPDELEGWLDPLRQLTEDLHMGKFSSEQLHIAIVHDPSITFTDVSNAIEEGFRRTRVSKEQE